MKKAVKKVEEEEEDSGSDLDVDEGYEDSDEDEAAQNDLKRGAVVSKVRRPLPLCRCTCAYARRAYRLDSAR